MNNMDIQMYGNQYVQNGVIQLNAENIFFQANSASDTLIYSGNAHSIKSKAQQLRNEEKKYKSIRIYMIGQVLQTFNCCLYVWTIIFGSILLLPLICLCLDCWRRKVFPLYRANSVGYEGICQIIKNSDVEQFYLCVQDNYFNQSRAEDIADALKKSRIKNFVFTNTAMGFNCEGNNFDDFPQYMQKIKTIVIHTEIRWANSIA